MVRERRWVRVRAFRILAGGHTSIGAVADSAVRTCVAVESVPPIGKVVRFGVAARGERLRRSPDGSQVSGACCHGTMDGAAGIAGHLGATVLERRRERHWTLRRLSVESGVSTSHLQRMEAGHPASLDAYVAVSRALGLRPAFDLVDPRRRSPLTRAEDPIHAAMGEAEAALLQGPGRGLSLDEPYQHFQFAGRADVVAWSEAERWLHGGLPRSESDSLTGRGVRKFPRAGDARGRVKCS